MLITDPTSPDFESFVTGDQLVAWAAKRDVTIAPDKADSLLIKAMDYMDTRIDWVGRKADPAQLHAWPRVQCNGDEISPLPPALALAQQQLAVTAMSMNLFNSTAGGAQVIEKRLEGVVDIKYSEASLGNDIDLPWLNSIITDLINSTSESEINFSVLRG